MSYVTDVILISQYLEHHTIDILNKYLRDQYGTIFNEISEYGGGNKIMQCFIYAGAFNYLDLEAFLDVVKALPPEEKENMQLLTSEEHDEKFTLREI